MFVRADNGVEADVARAVATTVERFGSLTTLVNNAISDDAGSGKRQPRRRDRQRHLRQHHADRADGDVLGVQVRRSREMRKAGSGSIVNISASSSKRALPERPAYHASKGAINALTRQMAVDYGKDDIRANTIIVGFVFTGSPEMTAILADPAMRAAFQKNIMVPRFGEPADIAAGVVYLASDESKYVTGIELTIDGGALCHQALPELDFETHAGREVSRWK